MTIYLCTWLFFLLLMNFDDVIISEWTELIEFFFDMYIELTFTSKYIPTIYDIYVYMCIHIYPIYVYRYMQYTALGTPEVAAAPSLFLPCVPALVPSFLRSFLRSFVRSADDRDLRIKFDNTETKPNQHKNHYQYRNQNETFTSYKHNYLMYLYLCELIWANLIWSWFVFVVQPEYIRLYIHTIYYL